MFLATSLCFVCLYVFVVCVTATATVESLKYYLSIYLCIYMYLSDYIHKFHTAGAFCRCEI